MLEPLASTTQPTADIFSWLPFMLLVISLSGIILAVSRIKRKQNPLAIKTKKVSVYLLLFLSIAAFMAALILTIFNKSFRATFLQWMNSAKIYVSLIWTCVSALVITSIGRIVRIALIRDVDDIRTKHKIRRTVQWGTYIVFVLSVIFIWASHLQALGVFLGFFAAGLALSLQEMLLCLAGWILIVIKKPYDIGDRIEVNNTVGDVIDIQTFQTYVLEVGNWVEGDQSTGRMIAIPNSSVFRGKVSNYTKGFPFIWNELKTVVTFDSDWKKAKEIILQQAQEEAGKIENEVHKQIINMQRDYAIRYQNLTPIVYTKIEDVGIALTLRYLTPVRKRRSTAHKISESILEEFGKIKNINFAYPTRTVYAIPTKNE
ncbi:MAG: mechanosensitive ion channel family protein [Planctomycetota bacterium]